MSSPVKSSPIDIPRNRSLSEPVNSTIDSTSFLKTIETLVSQGKTQKAMDTHNKFLGQKMALSYDDSVEKQEMLRKARKIIQAVLPFTKKSQGIPIVPKKLPKGW